MDVALAHTGAPVQTAVNPLTLSVRKKTVARAARQDFARTFTFR